MLKTLFLLVSCCIFKGNHASFYQPNKGSEILPQFSTNQKILLDESPLKRQPRYESFLPLESLKSLGDDLPCLKTDCEKKFTASRNFSWLEYLVSKFYQESHNNFRPVTLKKTRSLLLNPKRRFKTILPIGRLKRNEIPVDDGRLTQTSLKQFADAQMKILGIQGKSHMERRQAASNKNPATIRKYYGMFEKAHGQAKFILPIGRLKRMDFKDFLTVRNGNRVVINNEESIFRNQGDIPTESI